MFEDLSKLDFEFVSQVRSELKLSVWLTNTWRLYIFIKLQNLSDLKIEKHRETLF